MNEVKKNPTEWKRIFACYTLDMRIQKTKSRKQSDWKMGSGSKQRVWNRHDDGKPQRCSSSLAVRQMQIETTLTLHFTLVTLARINEITHNKCGEVVKKIANPCRHSGNQHRDFSKKN